MKWKTIDKSSESTNIETAEHENAERLNACSTKSHKKHQTDIDNNNNNEYKRQKTFTKTFE